MTRTTARNAPAGGLILASGSHIRAELLRAAGLEFAVNPTAIDEDAIKLESFAEGLTAPETADKLAWLKALYKSRSIPGAVVIGCDQMLEVNFEDPEGSASLSTWLNKPEDIDQLREQLRSLSGKCHSLYSAVVLVENGTRIWGKLETAKLTMHELSEEEIEAYLRRAGDGILNSVGGYFYEGLGLRLFARVDGDYHTILGMPLLPMLKFLRDSGRIAL
ncbi:MAG: Maf family protein [Alphaproteobacteria bacterium]|nr:Maf family protein [Alphaproteobacteria bacterium]